MTILTLTGGEGGGSVRRRASEAAEAASRLGAGLIMAGLPDRRLTVSPSSIETIVEVASSCQPNIVYTHSEHDLHQDHRATHLASLVAVRHVPNVFCYESPSTTTGFNPTRFVDIQGVLAQKLTLLEPYASQATRSYMQPDMVMATARYWSRFSPHQCVEPFEVVRMSSMLDFASATTNQPTSDMPPTAVSRVSLASLEAS